MAIIFKDPKVRAARKTRKVGGMGADELKRPEDVPGLINGIQAGSSYEWNIARGGWALGWTFQYQVPMFGGRMVRGGLVLDFIFPTRPARTVIQPEGAYWHLDTDLDEQEDIRILNELGWSTRMLHPGLMECGTFEAAMQYLRKEIGRA